ncbi:MAG: hypothetical protein VR72_13025 [Clostridiaceae bacterium BRH_c20a]|nr:MAG: hypothetical protein VR72_13025 [Clostridiaceae bacterium BRH_c20a]
MNKKIRDEIERSLNLKIIDEQSFSWGESYSLQLESKMDFDKYSKKNSRNVAVVTVKPNIKHESHTHYGYDEILYGLEGETIHWANSKKTYLQKGQLVLIPAEGQHIMVNNSPVPAKFLSIVYPTIPERWRR